MVDRDDIPQKIDLENSERAPRGDDPLIHFEEDDLSSETKQKIGDYFREKYTDDTKKSVADIRNQPELTAFSNSANTEDGYLAGRPEDQRGAFESDSGFFDKTVVPGKTVSGIKKTEIQASELVNVIAELPSFISDEVEGHIGENALHSSENPFVTNDRPVEDNAGTGIHLVQSRFGQHSPQKTFRNAKEDPAITIKNLRNLGHQILLEASGEIYVPDDLEDVAKVVAAKHSTVVPGLARLGFRIDANRFGAGQVINNVNNDIRKPSVEIDLEGPAKPSFGSVNNPLVPFSSIANEASSVVVGTLLVGTFTGIFTALSALLNNANPGSLNEILGGIEKGSDTRSEVSKRRLGSYIPRDPTNNDTNFGLALLGANQNLLVRTENDYGTCVQQGLRVFFGLDSSDILGSVGGTATRIAETPGYYNGVLRLLVRSISDPLSQIVGNIQGLAGGQASPSFTTGPADYDPIIGVPTDPTSLFESVRIVKESKFLKFMNVMANIGDIALYTQKRTADESSIDLINDVYEETNQLTGKTITAPNPAALIKKHRLSNLVGGEYNNSLAWGANTLPSVFMINREIVNAEALYGQTDNYNNLSTRRNFYLTDEKRLKGDIVDEIERRLDSYYMPFYFHDLRTNEIIAFHAFLESVTDSHSADYSESEGYGRIGKIYTYKNTNRTINLAFKVVAVNPQDFDAMWFKLNKLLMMLYPQYTLGRAISFDSKKFIQPFSQLPGASPMIRLRVGDLIKSNFNEFDLARLFGLGSNKFQVSQQQADADREREDRVREKYREIVRRHLGSRTNEQTTLPQFNQGEFFIVNEQISTIGSRTSQEQAIRRIGEPRRGASAGRLREIENAARQRRSHGIPDVPVNSRAIVNRRIRDGVYQIQFIPALAGEEQGSTYEIDFSRINSSTFIRIDEVSVRAQARREANQGTAAIDDQTAQEVSDFFNPDNTGGGSTRGSTPSQQQANTNGGNGATGAAQNSVGGNPVFQSFRSTRGKGLAGFIKSINFNWEGAVWETDAQNSKAPRWCTIDMEFAPVHDLNPGLDVNGNMIAPIYNVGSILQQMKVRRAGGTESQTEGAQSTSDASQTTNNRGGSQTNEP